MKPISLSRFLQWPINRATYRLLGWQRTLSYMQQLGRLFFSIQGKDMTAMARAVHMVFNDEPFLQRQCKIDLIQHGVIFHYFEKLFHAYASEKRLKRFFNTHVKDRGLSAIHEARATGHGALLVTGHIGGLEFMPAYLGHHGIPATIVGKMATANLRRAVLRQIDHFGACVIDADATANIPAEILRHLRANRVVITQCDEFDEWRSDPSQQIRFLGTSVHLDRTINVLARRAKVPVLFGLMHRDHWHQYVFFATDSETVAEQVTDSDHHSVGALAIKFLERFILQYPEEWYHWRHVPALAADAEPNCASTDTIPLPMTDLLVDNTP